MGMLYSKAVLARSKELFVDRSQIQGPSIDIKAGTRFSMLNMQLPHAVGGVFQNDKASKRAGRKERLW
jgi:hypothetical protein